MHRIAATLLGALLLVAGASQAQSLGDTARANRENKAKNGSSAAKVITDDDLAPAADSILRLIPGATGSVTAQGTIVAAGRGKHGYVVTTLDASQFTHGGVLHITITTGNGAAEASFDLYPQGAKLPSTGLPNGLASAHNVPSGAGAKIDYHFDHGAMFQFCAEGSWNAKLGETNTYTIVVDVSNR